MYRRFLSLFSLVSIIVFSLAAPLTASADDGQPGDPTPEATEAPPEDSGQGGVEDVVPEETAVDEVAQSADTVTETTAPESLVEEVATEDSQNSEGSPAENEQVAEVVEALDEAELVLLDASGEPIPLASEAAVEALTAPDPIGCPAGVIPASWGGTGAGCTGSYASIQAAINDGLVAAGWTIYIDAGTYSENVQVTKSVTLQGAGQGLTTLYPAFSDPGVGCTNVHSCVDATNTVIWVLADNISIFDLTVDGDNPFLISSVVVGGADIDARNGILTSTNTNLTVQDVTVQNVYGRGIQMSSHLGIFNFNNNTVDNVQGYSAMAGVSPSSGKYSSGRSSAGIFNFTSSGIISGNTITRVVNGISNNYSTGATISGNRVSQFIDAGIYSDNNQDADTTGDTDVISNNVISYGVGSQTYGIFVRAPYETVTVSGNNISKVDYGLTVSGHGWGNPTETILFNGNTVDANVVGAYITTDVWHAFSGDVDAVFSNNNISSAQYGFYLESQGSADDLPSYYSATMCPAEGDHTGQCTLHVLASHNVITTPTLADGIFYAIGQTPWYGVDPDYNGNYFFIDDGNIWRSLESEGSSSSGSNATISSERPLYYKVVLISGSATFAVTELQRHGELEAYGVLMHDIDGAIGLEITPTGGPPTFMVTFYANEEHSIFIALPDGSHYEIPTVCVPEQDGSGYACSALYTPAGSEMSLQPVVCLHD